MPETFRTKTLSFSILPMFWAETIAIISGRPSGTAMTIMMTASITASTASFSRGIQPGNVTKISNWGKRLISTMRWSMKASAMATPPI